MSKLKNYLILSALVFLWQFAVAAPAANVSVGQSSADAPLISSGTVVFSTADIKITPEPDYSQKENWALFPSADAAKADVFYVYPTIFGGNGFEVMDVNNETLRTKAKNQAVFDTGIFNGQANIYAPYYRQASIELLKLTKEENALFLMTGVSDVERAFDYYMTNYNKGKPFILAGFSQGSVVILELMKNKFYDKKLRDKLIAAYIIGYSVTKEDLEKYPYLKMAASSKDTGVIISYNTQVAGNGYSALLNKGAESINPVSWKTDNKKSKGKEYKGAVIFDINSNKITSGEKPFKTAYLEKETNALVVDVNLGKYNAGQATFPKGILHMYDYMFFYNNLKENAVVRINSYFKNTNKK